MELIEKGEIGLSIDQKIQKSQTIINEALDLYSPENMAIAITGGKDSTTNLWLFRQVCLEHGCSLPLCMFIDEGDVFDEIREFVDFLKVRWSLEIAQVKNSRPHPAKRPGWRRYSRILSEPGQPGRAGGNGFFRHRISVYARFHDLQPLDEDHPHAGVYPAAKDQGPGHRHQMG